MQRPRRNDHEPQPDAPAGPVGPPSLFTHAAATVTAPTEATSAPLVEGVERVEKPWGYEEVFGVLEGRYVGKVLHVRAGCALSLQWHLHKDETISVRSGQVVVEHGIDAKRLQRLTLDPGQRVHIRAGVVHRMTALVDSELLEVSTAWPGWRTDVVRLDDGYGRAGTSAP